MAIENHRASRLPLALFLSPLILATFRFWVLPSAYPGQTSIRYWGMAFFTGVGSILSLLIYEKTRLNAVHWLETHARTPYTWFVRLGGVIASFALAVVFFALEAATQTDAESVYAPGVFRHLAWANIAIVLFEMLPALSLDGGKALLDCFAMEGQWTRRGIATIYQTGIMISIAMLLGGAYCAFLMQYASALWLLILGYLVLQSNQQVFKILKNRKSNLTIE